MYNKNLYIIGKINRQAIIRKRVIRTCLSLFTLGLLIFVFYIFGDTSQAIKFVADYAANKEHIKEVQKVMTNPQIKFEHSKDNFYDITAKKAVHKSEEEVLLFDVDVKGDSMTIKSGKLLISNEGNDLQFTDKPVLVLKTSQIK